MEEQATLKHYRLLSRLGEGGMGVVYRAEDTRLGRTVALKMLHPDVAGDVERARRFEREARIISGMSHPGIATLYDFDREGDVAFLTMELVDGPSLRELLQDGALPIGRVLDCGVQVADALAAAHRGGVIHRDLKPENIMVAPSGYYKVLDFGVAHHGDTTDENTPVDTKLATVSRVTREGTLIGTLRYMSPEQVMGRQVDPRSDVFSLGSLLYELATGEPPFRGGNDIATAHAIAYTEPAPLRAARTDATPGLEAVVARCLEKSPEDRYPGAGELAEDLRSLRQDSQSGSRTAQKLWAYRLRRRRTGPWWIAGAVVLVLALAAGAIALWPDRGPEFPPPPRPRDPAPRAAGAVPAARTERPRILVALFDNNTGDADADWLGRGLPEMLTTGLSGSGDLDVIATQRLYDLMTLSGAEDERPQDDRSTTAELARWAGADLVVSGSVFRIGERYRIDAQVHDTATGTVEVARKVEGEDLLAMVDDLTAGLRSDLRVGSGKAGDMPRVTQSSEAFRLYAQGKDAYDGLRYEDAVEDLGQAVDLDPEFALARLRLGTSLSAIGRFEEAATEFQRVGERIDRLPESERILALAMQAMYRDGDFETGSRFLEDLVERQPGAKEAYVLWGAACSDLQDDPLDATRKLRRALEVDPNYLPAIQRLADQLVDLGLEGDAREFLEQAILRNPEARGALQERLDALPESTPRR